MTLRSALLGLACALALASAGSARAANCKVTGTAAVAFTGYDPYSPTPLQLHGTVSYDCTPPANPFLTLSAGNSGDASGRYLTQPGAADRLYYNVYTDAACTAVWTDQLSQAIAGVGAHNQTLDFWACAPARQNVSVGSYSDTLIVTINY